MPDRTEQIERLVSPTVADLGCRLVRVHLSGGRRPTLQIMAERADGKDISVEECAHISRAIAAVLEVEDPISGPYDLEVSSPGLDRPLVCREDFARFEGHEALIETARLIAGRRRFRGVLRGIVGDTLTIGAGESDVEIALADVAAAKLVMTDALIAESLKRGDRRNKD